MSIRFVYNYITKKMSTDPTLVPPGTLPTTFIPATSTGNVGYMVMSYPGRPQMVPGIPMPPGMGMPYMQLGAPPPLMPGVPMPMGHMMGAPQLAQMVPRPYRPTPVTTSAPPRPKVVPPVRYLPPQPDGPAVTVFVGNISERAPDQMIRFILSACGHVTSWKRVQGFGFCEFGNPDAGLRAIRLLHDYEIGGKKLVVKVDAKAQSVLEDYKNEKRKKTASSSPLQDESVDEDDYMDEDMKNSDKAALDRIAMILNDYENDMKNYVPPQAEEPKPSVPEIKLPPAPPLPKHHEGPVSVDLTDANIEDDRRDLITREIGKFREIMKKQEEEKEVERKKREEKERERRSDRSPGSRSSRARSIVHDRSSSPAESIHSRHRSHKSSRHRTKSRSRERERDRDREREKDRELRERDRDSERSRDRGDREREKERDSKSDRDLLREKEEEEEAKERKKQERKAREKEAAYQERLRAWESRERHKVKEALKEREKKRLKEEEREKEAKRLKEFLEDYDDERDDIKYYKGRELARRLEEREKEMEIDAKDRQKEKEELIELKEKIFSGNSEDPNAEFAKAMKAREEMYKPKILVPMNDEKKVAALAEKEKEKAMKDLREREKQEMEEEEEQRKRRAASPAESSVGASPAPAPPSPPSSPEQASPEPQPEVIKPLPIKGHTSPSERRKKKLDVKEVFNNDEDEEMLSSNKKRKLVPLDYTEDKKKISTKDMINPGIVKEVLHGKPDRETRERERERESAREPREPAHPPPAPVQPPPVIPTKEEKKEEQAKSQEEKRKHIKSLIDRIPTDKAALFNYMLDWAAVDNQLMERRIRPWINKKIIEYIGEPEPTLVDFICSKVLAGSAPQGILDDVQMVLDEEAEVFVVKMWRLLIYEIEAKKLGLVK